MGRSLWLITVLLALVACTSAANAPEPSADPTATEAFIDKEQNACDDVFEAVRPVLSFGGQRQDNSSIAINWNADGCVMTGHPIATLPLPQNPLVIPRGSGAQLEFITAPIALSGYAWLPDFAAAEEPAFGRVEVPLDELRGSTRVDIEFGLAASQQVDLASLPGGVYAIEVFAGWPGGSTGYAFHVEIIEP